MIWEDLEKYFSPIAEILPNGKCKVFMAYNKDVYEIKIMFS